MKPELKQYHLFFGLSLLQGMSIIALAALGLSFLFAWIC